MVRQGHPWLFDGGIEQQSHVGRPGDLAVIFDSKRKFQGIGLFDPHSPIRVKLLHHGKPVQIDEDWFKQRVFEALERRRSLQEDPNTTGYRLIYGEGDRLPGLVVDRYDATLVIKLYTAAWFPHLNPVIEALLSHSPFERGILRLSRNLQIPEVDRFGLEDGSLLWGMPPEGPVSFVENGLSFAADVVHGHKTGFFFDHRDNRERVGNLARGRSVLDLFAYSGGFSVYAAAGGAVSVTSVDISKPALEAAAANFERNQDAPTLPLAKHTALSGDVFDLLDQFITDEIDFDLVVVDPPAFAKRQDEIDRALKAYARLTEAVLNVLAPGGILVFASCSSRVSAELFQAAVYEAAESAGRPLWTHFHTGHALDHPVLDSFPEGRYLKSIFASPID